MLIKQPDSDLALSKLWDIIAGIRNRFNNCVVNRHDIIDVLYISSYMMSPGVAYQNRRLLDEIVSIVDISPRNFICIVRTTAPSNFPGMMGKLQNQAINSLRSKCYVITYDKNHQFTNHAKFIMHYHICFSENIVYHSRYYGSTNLTTAGLAYYVRRNRTIGLGNYEEFFAKRLQPRSKLNKKDLYYIEEILQLINHKMHLYTNAVYLEYFVKKYIWNIGPLLDHANKVISGTTMGKLYETYVDLLAAHNETYAFLNEIPGKLITEKLIEEMNKIEPSTNLSEIEMLIPSGPEQAELMAKYLELSDTELRKTVKEYIDALEKAIELIEGKYIPLVHGIYGYLDEKERSFLEFVKSNGEYHMKSLEKAIGSYKSRNR